MHPWLLLTVAICVLAGLAAAPHASFPGYDNFMALAPSARTEAFSRLSADDKAALKRTHAERWLAGHRDRLTTRQVEVTRNAIDFITPDIYRQPDDPGIAARERSIKRDLTCVLGREYAQQAFMLDAPPSAAGRTWRSRGDAWLSWFSECVIG